MLFAERVWLSEGRVLDVLLDVRDGEPRYRLRAGSDQGWTLQYDNDAGHRRVMGGRAAPYVFRSVEQLRYDFERDLEALIDGDDSQA